MTTKFKTRGVVLDYVNASGALIPSGAVVVIGTKVGVALTDIANTSTGSVQMAGVFEVAKLSTDVMAQGALVYWDTANSRLTTTAGGNTLAGHVYVGALAATVTVQFVVNSVPC